MKVIRFLEGFLLGSLAGAVAATLLAPESGQDLRLKVRHEVERIRGEVQSAATDRRAELEEQLSALRSPHRVG
ncbi:MAG TPA: YtxH domain-containing protein [Anaerolineales bacterium]|nr:YtxH domain-containing protein [Anaerolineales bacterium]